MAGVELREVEKVFANGTTAVRALSLEAGEGELLVLLGPSGCGKSTLLRMVAGLEPVSSGEIRIGGRTVNDLTPQERNVAMVFQNYALYPHMTVRENLAFPLRMRRLPRREIAERVERAARTLGLEGVLDRRPRELSGGQRQRVAMGRAIVRDPAVFLMDEPLSNLDAKLRVEVRGEIAALQRRIGVTMLYVTHDQIEAMTLGQRVAVMRAGTLQQVDRPQALYERPANLFVAGFLGSPAMNLFRAELVEARGVPALRIGDRDLSLPPDSPGAAQRDRARVAGLRPEALRWPAESPGDPVIAGEVTLVEALGHERVVHLDAPVTPVDPESGAAAGGSAGGGSLAARLAGGRRVEVGERIELAVDTRALHWFDAEGRAVRAD